MGYDGHMVKSIEFFWMTLRYLYSENTRTHLSEQVRKAWAQNLFSKLKMKIHQVGSPCEDEPLLFVSNHRSYIDIPLLIATIRNGSFVSKKEVASWPIIGTAAKRMNTIFLDRSDRNSSQQARQEMAQAMLTHRSRIILFPSGTTSESMEVHWKKGAFELSLQHQIPIQPVRIHYTPNRLVSYIDNDTLIWHLERLGRTSHLEAHIEFHPPLLVKNVALDLEYCRRWCTFQIPTPMNVIPGVESHESQTASL